MGDVIVNRCTVRVRRRGTWSWGPDARRVVDAAARAVPALLARRLEALWPDELDGEVRRPARLRLTLPLSDLAELATALAHGGVENAVVDDARVAAFDAQLAQAVTALAGTLQPEQRFAVATPAAAPSTDTPRARATVAETLLAWRAAGSLPWLLAGFGVAALEAWLRALDDAPSRASTRATAPAPSDAAALAAALAATLAAALPDPPGDDAPTRAAQRLRRRLLLVVELMARVALSAREAVALAAPLDAVDAVAADVIPAATETPAQPLAVTTPSPPAAGPPARAATPPTATALADCEVAALPFLLLSPLAQTGLLGAIETSFAVAGRAHQLAAFAVGLAAKVLPPPERGWRRSPKDVISLCGFADVADVPDDLAALAHDPLDDVAPPIAALSARVLLDAHTRGQPYVIARADDELVLADADGLSPIAVGDAPTLLRLVAAVRDPLLVAAAAASPALLAALHAQGCRFVTDAPPTRHEPWRRLRASATDRFWSNDAHTPDATQCAWARPLADLADELAATWHALAVERAVVPAPRAGALDHLLSLLAGLGLGYLAWTLWREGDVPHPRLALRRFGDLTARLRKSDGALALTLPLGAREQDLRRHRLLGEVRHVPWLGGRAVRFAGG